MDCFMMQDHTAYVLRKLRLKLKACEIVTLIVFYFIIKYHNHIFVIIFVSSEEKNKFFLIIGALLQLLCVPIVTYS